MSEASKDIGVVKLTDVRLSFPVLWEPRPPQDNPNGTKTFSAAFIVDRDSGNEKAIRAAMTAVAKAKWGDKAQEVYNAIKASDRLALHDGDSKPEVAGYRGKFFMNARSELRPTVVDRNRTPLAAADGKPYAGCYVNAFIQLWAQDNKYGKRINVQLMGVQFLRDGERLAGGTVASAEDFEAIGGDESDGAANAEEMFG